VIGTDSPDSWEDVDGSVRTDDSDPWPDPVPLAPPRTPAAFPVDALPGWAADYVAALAEATQTPPEMAGCCVLGVLSACSGGRAVVQARAGWREPTNLYLLPVMRPGSRKSAVIAAATRPLNEVQHELQQQARAKACEAGTLREIAKKAAEKALRAAANATGEQQDKLSADAVTAAGQADAIELPVIPRLIADDVTPEAAASLLADHGGRLAIISAEGGIFDTMAGRYSSGVPILDLWLKGHAGDVLSVDRKGRPAEYVEQPALTLLLTAQPAVLAAIARNRAVRGRGLPARFLYALPDSNIGRRKIGAAPVPDAVTETYVAHVRKLAADLADWTDPAVLTLDHDAHELLLNTERTIEPQLAEDDGQLGTGLLAEWGSKLAGAMLRIAGLLHVAAEAEAFRTPISAATLTQAVRIGTYFAEHARAALGLLGESETGDASYVLDYLARKGIESFTIRSLHVELPRGRFATAEDVSTAVDVLTEHGYVAAEPPPERTGPGRKPSPGYRVHPSVTTESTESTE